MNNANLLHRAAEQSTLGRTSGSAQTTAQSCSDSDAVFYVHQDGTTYSVEPLDAEDYDCKTLEEFYAYGEGDGASANTPNDMEESDVSQLFFYDGPEGLSLGVIHDAPEDGDGGSVTFQFDGLPDGDWVVPDDSGDDEYDRQRIDWSWVSCCTDGGAYRGAFDGRFWLTITPDFHDGIDSTEYEEPWVVVDGPESDLERKPLDPTKPITITSRSKLPQEDDADYTLKVGTDVCLADESIEGDVCFSSDPVVRIGPRPCESLPGGVTPPLMSMDFTYFQTSETEDGVEVEFSRNIWIGVELRGNGCIWWGEEVLGICETLGDCRSLPGPTVFGVPNPEAARQAARDTRDDMAQNDRPVFQPGIGEEVLVGVIALALIALAILVPEPSSTAAGIAALSTVVLTADEVRDDDDVT